MSDLVLVPAADRASALEAYRWWLLWHRTAEALRPVIEAFGDLARAVDAAAWQWVQLVWPSPATLARRSAAGREYHRRSHARRHRRG